MCNAKKWPVWHNARKAISDCQWQREPAGLSHGSYLFPYLFIIVFIALHWLFSNGWARGLRLLRGRCIVRQTLVGRDVWWDGFRSSAAMRRTQPENHRGAARRVWSSCRHRGAGARAGKRARPLASAPSDQQILNIKRPYIPKPSCCWWNRVVERSGIMCTWWLCHEFIGAI